MFHLTLQVTSIPYFIRYFSVCSTPLKILFFGSDNFSILSLKALHAHYKNSNHIKQLDVVVRHQKPSGRGMKVLSDPPLSSVAKSLGLDTIRAETKQELEELIRYNYDMLIAVSFGKLIPSTLIESVKYTLNVHPSLLPRYSGASPLQHALINDDNTTGVTVQTLHPTKFDHGEIIDQTSEISITKDENIQSLTEKLGKIGADLLVNIIKTESFKSPNFKSKYEYSYAGKISKDKKIILWKDLTSNQIMKMYSAFETLITFKDITFKKRRSPVQRERRRVLLSDIYKPKKNFKLPPGNFDFIDDELLVGCKDGIIGIGTLQMEYQKKEKVKIFWNHLKKRIGDTPLKFVS